MLRSLTANLNWKLGIFVLLMQRVKTISIGIFFVIQLIFTELIRRYNDSLNTREWATLKHLNSSQGIFMASYD